MNVNNVINLPKLTVDNLVDSAKKNLVLVVREPVY